MADEKPRRRAIVSESQVIGGDNPVTLDPTILSFASQLTFL